VEDSSLVLADRISVSLESTTKYNNQAFEAFMNMRSVMYTESKTAIANFRDQLMDVVQTEKEITEMHKTFPDLVAPAHVVNVVVPLGGKYVDIAMRAVAVIEKKQAQLEIFSQEGEDLSNTVRELVNVLDDRLKKSVRDISIETDKGSALALENAMYLTQDILEKIMALRCDAWRAIFVAQTGGGVEDLKKIDGRVAELVVETKALKTLYTDPKEQEMLELLLSDFANFESALGDFIHTCVELDQLHKDRVPIQVSLNNEVLVANQMAVDRVKKISKENIDRIEMVLTVMTSSAAICVILAIVIAFFIARSISKPLNTIVDLVKRAGDGDLTIKKEDFGYEGDDEMGHMVEAISEMVQSLNSTMTQIVQIAKELTDGAGDLSSIAEETNAAMEEIKASIIEVSGLTEANGSALEESNAGVEEMSSGADTVATSATDSAAFIATTTNASNDAIQTVHSVINGMRDVDKNAKESESKMRQLVSSVENVSGFVSVITGIADQTNLLALNAAIEAARAGEAGRGFAVVAEEVRKLAEESARAANSVNKIIQDLQTGAQESIQVTTEAGRLLVTTLEHAEHALKELNGALTQMNKANESIQNIAAVAQEQAASSREIAQAIDNATKSSMEIVGSVSNIQRASDETTHGTEGVAQQAEKMTTSAQTLSELLAMFKLESSEPVKTARMLKAG